MLMDVFFFILRCDLGTGLGKCALPLRQSTASCLLGVSTTLHTQVMAEFSQHGTLTNEFDRISKLRERVS